jgi:DtxR family Mn-dependent transcriptional regulator
MESTTMELWWIIAIAAAAILAVFLPRLGLLGVWRRWQAAREREQVEDALKHLLDRQQQGRSASPDSLAGSLNISRQRAVQQIESMEKQGLLVSGGSTLALTPDGEHWALHVVRAHRLWERFLADEARMPLTKVHEEAHRREHSSTPAQLDEMDAAMGHPSQDPHGDPIPTRDGHLNALGAQSLTEWQIGEPAVIVHLEDEPAIAYDQILAAGIRLGQTIRLIERDSRRVVFSDGEQEFRLAPAVAANIQVSTLSATEQLRRSGVPLTEIPLGQPAEILLLDESVQGFTRRRFLDLGLTPGTRVQPELGTFFGDPRAYRVRGTLIALRTDQATTIWVRPISPAVSDSARTAAHERRAKDTL